MITNEPLLRLNFLFLPSNFDPIDKYTVFANKIKILKPIEGRLYTELPTIIVMEYDIRRVYSDNFEVMGAYFPRNRREIRIFKFS